VSFYTYLESEHGSFISLEGLHPPGYSVILAVFGGMTKGHQFLGALAKLLKATIKLVMFVRSHETTGLPLHAF
jgi:hypothetical protein